MTIEKSIYCGGQAKDYLGIIRQIKAGKIADDIFFICIAGQKQPAIEVLRGRDLFTSLYRWRAKEYRIIGFAKGREEIVHVLHHMVKKAFKPAKKDKMAAEIKQILKL